jgi:hypothetical protein
MVEMVVGAVSSEPEIILLLPPVVERRTSMSWFPESARLCQNTVYVDKKSRDKIWKSRPTLPKWVGGVPIFHTPHVSTKTPWLGGDLQHERNCARNNSTQTKKRENWVARTCNNISGGFGKVW